MSKMPGKTRKELLPKPRKGFPRQGTALAEARAGGLRLGWGVRTARERPSGELGAGKALEGQIGLGRAGTGWEEGGGGSEHREACAPVDQKPVLRTMMDTGWEDVENSGRLLGVDTGRAEVRL